MPNINFPDLGGKPMRNPEDLFAKCDLNVIKIELINVKIYKRPTNNLHLERKGNA